MWSTRCGTVAEADPTPVVMLSVAFSQ
jgi:hypothetical protein